jgi:hypothetical protein
MTWNYRVCRETYNKGTAHEEVGYTVREVYYDKDGKITACTENAVSAYGESVEEIKSVLERMQLGINKEVVDVDTIFDNKTEDSLLN